MTKQQKTYLLLIATGIVWGVIGYQMYNRLNPKQELLTKNSSTEKYEPQKLIEVNPYTINTNYRDPFLGKFPKNKKVVSKKKNTKPTKKKPFHKISYNGIIEGTSQSFIITVNGAQETFNLHETINGITLLKANSEEISVSFNGETKTFKQQ